eukprot:12925632-Prorocentrum_lima.AAC.1
MMRSGEEEHSAGRYDYQDYGENTWQSGIAFSSQELPLGAIMTSKIPPSFNGNMSWFAFEEL